jgi:hypothetical protein
MGGVQALTTRVPLMISCSLANDAWDFKRSWIEYNTCLPLQDPSVFCLCHLCQNENVVKCEVRVGNVNVLFISLKKIGY